jgi:hypothetical protein
VFGHHGFVAFQAFPAKANPQRRDTGLLICDAEYVTCWCWRGYSYQPHGRQGRIGLPVRYDRRAIPNSLEGSAD